MATIYRSYEMLIEETVRPDSPKRAKTSKPSRYCQPTVDALALTNWMFQDAVCYYTTIISGMTPLNHPAHEMVCKRFAEILPRLQKYPAFKSVTSVEDFWQNTFGQQCTDAKYHELLLKVFARLEAAAMNAEQGAETEESQVEEQTPGNDSQEQEDDNGATEDAGAKISAKLNKIVSMVIQRLCKPGSKQADSNQRRGNDNYFAELRKCLEEESKKNKFNDAEFADKIELKCCFTSPKGEVSGEDAYEDYVAALSGKRGDKQLSSLKTFKFGPFVEDLKRLQKWKEDRLANWPAKVAGFQHKSYSGTKPSVRLFYCLMYRFCRDEKSRESLLTLLKGLEPKPLSKGGKDEISNLLARSKTGCAFPFFTSLAAARPEKKSDSPKKKREGSLYLEFDKSAFKRALEDVLKYRIRTEKRADELARLSQREAAFLGQGKLAEDQPSDGRQEFVNFGMEGDKRKELMEKLLGQLAAKRGPGEQDYALRRATIGGWSVLREEFLKIPQDADGEPDEEDLEAKITQVRDKSGGGFGSGPFFSKLCGADYHPLWKDNWAESLKAKQEAWHAPDFVRHYVLYKEVLTKLDRISKKQGEQRIPEPINFTWAGELNRKKDPSFKPFELVDRNLAPTLKVRLFHQPDGSTGTIQTQDFEMTLSSRRLKRDQITLPNGESLKSFYAPPLVAGEGKKPKLHLTKVSFSLIAPKKMLRVGETEVPAKPFHVTLGIKLENDHLKILQKGMVFWGRSLAWSHKLVGWYFRWPIDKLTEAAGKITTACDKLKKQARQKKNEDEFQRSAEVLDSLLKEFRNVLPLDADALLAKTAKEHASLKEVKAICDSIRKLLAQTLWCGDGKTRKKKKLSPVEEDRFHALFIDLGVRYAGAFSRAEIAIESGNRPKTTHVLSPPGFQPEIWGTPYGLSTLRLQGEDAKIWHRPKDGSHNETETRFLKQNVPQSETIYRVERNGSLACNQTQPLWPTKDGEKNGWRFGRELYGSRGRLVSTDEFKEVFTGKNGLAERLFPSTKRFPLPTAKSDAARFIPAMAEHLVTRFERRLSRLGFLFTLRWRLMGSSITRQQDTLTYSQRKPEEQNRERRIVVESLASAKERGRDDLQDDLSWNDELRNEIDDVWVTCKDLLKKSSKRKDEPQRQAKLEQELAAKPKSFWKGLEKAVEKQLEARLRELSAPSGENLVEHLARFVWPLRDKQWCWRAYESKENPSRLFNERLKSDDARRKIIGQGGLSMARIELLQRFRRCCVSLARHEERHAKGCQKSEAGLEPYLTEPDTGFDKRCPDLAEKINELREQRVNQTAHMILAEALGLELKNPAEVEVGGLRKWELKSERDLHGWYKRKKVKLHGQEIDAPRCSVIVVEDLSRYRTSQDRSRFENRQLMEWSHRKLITKLQDMAKLFGITVIAVDARYSSRFCSKTHLPGVRVQEVKVGFEKQHPWKKWAEETRKGKEGTRVKTDRANRIQKLVQLFEKTNYGGTLLIEMDGGPSFIAVDGTFHSNADINAAVNIGFRALTHPDCLEFFPVLRTESVGSGKLSITNRRGTLVLLPEAEREFAPVEPPSEKPKNSTTSSQASKSGGDEDLESAEKPYLFVLPTTAAFGDLNISRSERYAVRVQGNRAVGPIYNAARGKIFWSRVADECSGRNGRIDEWNNRQIATRKNAKNMIGQD